MARPALAGVRSYERKAARLATLRGNVQRMTFRNDDNHFTVAKLEVDELEGADGTGAPVAPGLRSVSAGTTPRATTGASTGTPSGLFADGPVEVTIVGRFASLAVGEWVEVEGEWVNHETFGWQFHVSSYRKSPPATARGIARYLGSGVIEGVGPKLAERLVEAFGERTLEVIEKEPYRLLEVPGIGVQKQKAIGKALREESEVRDALIFLEGLGLAPGTAAKVYRHYQGQTIATVQANPYALAQDIFGIGFRTADALAQEMGWPADSPKRAAAALLHHLEQASSEGHLYLPERVLMEAVVEMDIPEASAQVALEALASEGDVVVEAIEAGERAVYPSFLHRVEVEIARRLAERARKYSESEERGTATSTVASVSATPPADDSTLTRLVAASGLSAEQKRAVETALRPGGGLMVLTGGPGTGKTTTLRAIVEGLKAMGRLYHLAAPTGRAAKRLKEATGEEAKTIHRLLEFSGGGGAFQFQRNEKAPLKGDTVIIDEASMIDAPLMFHLLRAVPQEAKLILVGDADQLPSVGPGNVLGDVLRAAPECVVPLTQVFRQAEQSRIVVNAHRILQGLSLHAGGEDSDFFFVRETDPEKAKELICQLVATRLPRYLNCDARRDVQVLATVRRGALGVDALNEALQQALNPPVPGGAEVIVAGQRLRPGDRVMQVRNDYDKMVFNGDIGTVMSVDPSKRVVEVHFADRDEPGPVVYQSDEVTQLTLAYCTSVHKSQGSEYPAVVMPITWVMPALMSRNLLYTAITRAKRLVVLVGRQDALAAYIRNDRADRRYTRLAERMWEANADGSGYGRGDGRDSGAATAGDSGAAMHKASDN